MNDAIVKSLIGVAIAAALGVAYLVMHFQVKSEVEKQLADAAYPSSATIALLQKDVDANTERAENLKENDDKLDSKIERIVQILLED